MYTSRQSFGTCVMLLRKSLITVFKTPGWVFLNPLFYIQKLLLIQVIFPEFLIEM